MRSNLTEEDEGKTVVNADGTTVGIVAEVEHGTAQVDPDPDLTDRIETKLGWGDADKGTYAVQDAEIDEITDDEVRLKAF